MTTRTRFLALFLCAALVGGCATVTPPPSALEQPRAGAAAARLALDRATEDRILAIDPLRVTEDDVRGPLAKAPCDGAGALVRVFAI